MKRRGGGNVAGAKIAQPSSPPHRGRWRIGWVLLGPVLIGAVDSTSAQTLEGPGPEVYARAEDQQRARLLKQPCAEADVGHGCYRYDKRLIRYAPCVFRIDARSLGSTPTDQCFKMDKPRRYRGVWTDAFEGQEFIPDGTILPEWPRVDPATPGWREQFERRRAASIWLDVDRANLGSYRQSQAGQRVQIEFIGRKTKYPGHHGHMGMSGHEIIVDRVISLKPLG